MGSEGESAGSPSCSRLPFSSALEVPQAASVSLSLPLQQNPLGTRRRGHPSKAPWRRAHSGFLAPRLGRWLLGAGRGGLGCSGAASEGRRNDNQGRPASLSPKI